MTGEPSARPASLVPPVAWFVAFVAAFYATAIASDFFVDWPFTYVTSNEWAQKLVLSSARFPSPDESGLMFDALVFLTPAILWLAYALAARDAWDPRRALPTDALRARRWASALAVLAVALAGACRLFITRGIPILDDERSYLFQASLFAAGKKALPAAPEALRNPMFILQPAVMSKYPPGQALALLPGVVLHAPWLMPLVIVGLLTLGVHRLVRDEYGERPALAAAAFMALCPCMAISGATSLSFPTMACAGLWCLTALGRAARTERASWNSVAGACLGYAFLTRPLDAFAFALPVAMTLGRAIERRETPRPVAALMAFIAGFAPVAAILPLWNWWALGSPLRMGYVQAHDYSFGFGVRAVPGGAYMHTPVQAVGNLMVGLLRLDLWLLGWPASLLLVLVGLLGPVVGRVDRMIRLVVPTYMLFGLLVASSGVADVGPAYLVPLAPLLVAMAARGVQILARTNELGARARRALVWTCVLGCVTGWLTIEPLRWVRLRALTSEMTVPWKTIESSGIGDAIVILPAGAAMGAVGYGLGYPFEVPTGPHTRARLCRLFEDRELEAARAFLGAELPVYRLVLDADAFERRHERRYALVKQLTRP